MIELAFGILLFYLIYAFVYRLISEAGEIFANDNEQDTTP
jgi:hypothetical protein